MARNVAYLLRGVPASVLAVAVAASLAFVPALRAEGDEIDRQIEEKQAEANEHWQRAEGEQATAYELAQQIEERQAVYAAALAEVDAANAEIEDNENRLAELEREMPEQERRSNAAARELYKFQRESVGIIDVLLSATNFSDFIDELEYVNRISQAGVDEINRLKKLQEEVSEAQIQLRTARTEAEMRAEDARVALVAAQEAQAEVQRRIEEESRVAAEIAAMAEELAKQPRDNDQGSIAAAPAPAEAAGTGSSAAEASEAGESSGTGEAEVAAPSAPVASSDEEAFVSEWTKRIDAYLSGSPLAGQGETFARAAYAYGVDPRFSPAISFTESSKGQYCFKPHNAWGWGSSSWDSWEEAIYDHVAGLARGYGGQISEAGAKKYCPPNWKTWYSRTLAQMELI